jgi:hypothetical protein
MVRIRFRQRWVPLCGSISSRAGTKRLATFLTSVAEGCGARRIQHGEHAVLATGQLAQLCARRVGLRWRWHLICRRAQIPPTSTSERSVALFGAEPARRLGLRRAAGPAQPSARHPVASPARQPLRRHRDTEWVARAAPPSRNWPTRAARCSIFNIRFRCRGCIAWANDNRSGTRSVAARASTPIS